MKRLSVILLCLMFVVSLLASCGQKEEAAEQADTPAVGHPEEVADTTRLDSAAPDTVEIEAVEEVTDSV